MPNYRYSRRPAHARRQLAKVQAQIAHWRATNTTGNWRLASDKARALAALEIQELRWLHVLSPPPLEDLRLPF